MVTIKVKGGTLASTEFLCRTCSRAQIITGARISEERVLCRIYAEAVEIRFPVSECTMYEDKRLPSKYDMEKIAWILLTKKPGRSIGFVSVAQFRELEGDDAEIIPSMVVKQEVSEEE